MFENILNFLRKLNKKEYNNAESGNGNSKVAAKERLHLVLMQDRANVSADFLELMKQEIIDVIKKYIEVDESSIDVRLTNKDNGDGTNGAPALYANIPILNIKNEARKIDSSEKQSKIENNIKDNNENEENVSEDKNKQDEAKKSDVEQKEKEDKIEEQDLTKEEIKSE